MIDSSNPPSRQEILDALAEAGAPLNLEALVTRMKVPPEAMVGMRRRVAAMQRDGQILLGRKGDLMLVSRIDLIAGKVQGHRDGFGFLLPDGEGEDIFLPPREMQKVMHGDRVLVRRVGTDHRGRPEGKIVEVTARNRRQVVGRLVNERGVLLVVPEDQRIKHEILIEPGGTMGAKAGQVVSVEIIEPPGWNTPPIARVSEVLGDVDDAGMEIEIAVRKFDVPHRFSEALLAETAVLPDALRPADYRGRVDLRDVPLVTIDGADARDFDDAVYCEPYKGADGRKDVGWRLLVAIADVSHYVRPGSLLDQEAQARTTSVYFPRRVIPMLPEKLSNGLCSINPEVDRLVLVADMVVDTKGEVIAYQFYPAVMHSAARLTYDEVWGILSGEDKAAMKRRSALVPQLKDLYDLYHALERARQARGAIEFETAETQMLCDDSGHITSIVARHRNDAHKLIEECMLAANTCAADFLGRNKHPGLYRVHEGPSADRLAKLREFLSGTGLRLGDAAAEAKEKRGPRPQDYQLLSRQISERDDAALLQTMMLRSMQQAVYTPDNQGHFGLAYDAYAHFTSPIRRYPDLLNHRAIKALLEEKRYRPEIVAPSSDGSGEDVSLSVEGRAVAARMTEKADQAASAAKARRRRKQDAEGPEAQAVWETLGLTCSANERRADEATRDVEAWLKCLYMRDRVGEQYPGRITGVAPFGVFVTLNDLYVEGMVHVSELGHEYFRYEESAHALVGERTGQRYALTDEVWVQVSAVNLDARRIDFRLIEAQPGGGARGQDARRGSGRVHAASGPLREEGRPGDGRPGRDRRAAEAGTAFGAGGALTGGASSGVTPFSGSAVPAASSAFSATADVDEVPGFRRGRQRGGEAVLLGGSGVAPVLDDDELMPAPRGGKRADGSSRKPRKAAKTAAAATTKKAGKKKSASSGSSSDKAAGDKRAGGGRKRRK
ncbi:MAG: ribonuclease R [Lautropia sp.]|nr:ribonuclease R [Lautropia sp.]